MDSELACIDGHLVAAAEAVIPVTDEGLMRGDGVFEVVRLYRGRPFALAAHLERLQRSATGLRLEIDIVAIGADIATVLAAHRDRDGLLRVMCTRGGRRITLTEPLPAPAETLSLAAVTYAPTRILDGIKSLSYASNMLAMRLAGERGVDDALLVSPHGRVLECATSSFFVVRGGEVWTPPLSDHVLDSITRRCVLAVARVREEPLSVESLGEADEAFVASSVREVVGVHRVDEHHYAAPGPVTREVAALVRERISSELT